MEGRKRVDGKGYLGAAGRKVYLIANPASQRGNAGLAAELASLLLLERYGEGVCSCMLTERPGQAGGLAASVQDPDAVVLALGGDGTIHEVAGGLMTVPEHKRPVFGIIPMGSGNDYARTLGMPEGVEAAIAQLALARPVPLDVGCCNGEFFVETLSFGLDAAIALDTVARRERTGQQGTALYLASGIDQLLHHLDPYHVRASLYDAPDAEPRVVEQDVFLFTVQNGPTYGGGFRICPDADPADGLFDLCYAAAPMGVVEATFKFLRAKNAHHVKYRKIHFDRACAIDLEFDKQPPCQIDGEPHIADSYHVTMHPRALRVLVPPR